MYEMTSHRGAPTIKEKLKNKKEISCCLLIIFFEEFCLKSRLEGIKLFSIFQLMGQVIPNICLITLKNEAASLN